MNKHRNKPLQNYFNKNGREAIVVWQVAPYQRDNLLSEEQRFIDLYGTVRDGRAFNVLPTAGNNLGYRHSNATKQRIAEKGRGRIATEETRRKRSFALKGRTFSDQWKQRISKAKKGKAGRKLSKAEVARIVKEKSKPFRLLAPSGEIFEGQNISDFARQHGLNQGHLSTVVKGKASNHKGRTKTG